MRRRDLFYVLGSAATWPLEARGTAGDAGDRVSRKQIVRRDGGPSAAFRHGLKEVGFVDGENVRIVYRWAENRLDRLPEMAADLVREQVAVIVTSGGPTSALAAKAATATIPVVFLVGEDPTRLGLVSSLARPTGNLTGINLFANELEAKRLELLHQVVPRAVRIAVLVNSADARNTEKYLAAGRSGCSCHGAADPGPQSR